MMRSPRPSRGGFTLIEIMVAIVILVGAGLALSALMLRSGRTARGTGAMSYRAAVLNAEVSRIAALPPSALTNGTTTTTVTTPPFTYVMTSTVATSGTTQTVTITVTPTGANAVGAVSRAVTRSTATGANPFNL